MSSSYKSANVFIPDAPPADIPFIVFVDKNDRLEAIVDDPNRSALELIGDRAGYNCTFQRIAHHTPAEAMRIALRCINDERRRKRWSVARLPESAILKPALLSSKTKQPPAEKTTDASPIRREKVAALPPRTAALVLGD